MKTLEQRVRINPHDFKFFSRSQMKKRDKEAKKRINELMKSKVANDGPWKEERDKAKMCGLNWHGYIDYRMMSLTDFVEKHKDKARSFITSIQK